MFYMLLIIMWVYYCEKNGFLDSKMFLAVFRKYLVMSVKYFKRVKFLFS